MIMKNFKVFAMSLLAAGAFSLASCSSSDELGSDTNKSEVSGTQYVTVKIVTNGGAGSRASYTDGYGTYEDGTAAESKVSKIRFYLFNEDGSAYTFRAVTTKDGVETTATTAHNWVDITPTMKENGSISGETVEAQTEATLIMKGTTTTSPKKIVAVANLTRTDADKDKDYTLSELAGVIGEYTGNTDGYFVMTNSVYLNGSTVMNYADLSGKVYTEENKAKAENNAATIYIERALAKVNTTLDADKYADAKTKAEVGTLADGTKVYAKVLGWAVTTEASQSYLLKSIDTQWNDNTLGFTTTTGPWNSADYHRSFWAQIPSRMTYGYHKYSDIKDHYVGTALYTQENTNLTESNPNATKIIVAAQLVDTDGKAVELCKFGGNEYTGEENVKIELANTYKNLGYRKKVENGYESLTTSDFTLEYKTAGGDEYQLVAVLNSSLDLYRMNGTTATSTTKDAIDSAMKIYTVTVAKTGYVYYFTTIQHLNSKPGVVRNHSYQLNLQDIKGYGTPVYKPERDIDIIPVIPAEDPKTYLAAQCKVLSWRIVSNNVNFKDTAK